MSSRDYIKGIKEQSGSKESGLKTYFNKVTNELIDIPRGFAAVISDHTEGKGVFSKRAKAAFVVSEGISILTGIPVSEVLGANFGKIRHEGKVPEGANFLLGNTGLPEKGGYSSRPLNIVDYGSIAIPIASQAIALGILGANYYRSRKKEK